MIKGFKDFIMRGNVIDLAVAVVIGANEHTIYENGNYYPNKGEKGQLFEQVVEGLFFGGEIPAQPQGK